MFETIFNSSTIIRHPSQYFNNHGGIDLFETSSLSLESLFNKIRNDANTLLSTSSTQSDVFLSSYFMIAITFSSSSSFSLYVCCAYVCVCVRVSLVSPGWRLISFRHGLSSRSDHINMCEFVCSKTVNEWKKKQFINIHKRTYSIDLLFSFRLDARIEFRMRFHLEDSLLRHSPISA
jgi:hypothetical protein